MGQDVITRPDWAPISAAHTIVGQAMSAWSESHPPTVEVPADLSPELAEEWQRSGGVAFRLALAQRAADNALAAFSEPEEFDAAIAGFDALPEAARTAIIGELSMGTWGAIRVASDGEVSRFGEDEDGAALVAEWRGHAPRKVAVVNARLKRVLKQMSREDGEAAATWFSELPAEASIVILRELAR